ncbi:hypothetical protein [Myroides pelagicus]|uniref:Outermembrane protein n=1 Tax=Myroides pelagicus TaxID=270914 RepID=A0A7K1GQC0_9FLAO|nr:hypothetical protein [Myroides pelagicus]MEC4115052.1 hypothetical protein [Myroides pelagicus]MTH30930.1 hypothetical protein [Myroides pelagicus]
MKHIYKLIAVLCLFSSMIGIAQEAVTTPLRYTDSNKGKFYVYWGGNRGYFSNSDIRFRGADYDFTLEDVQASDRPKGWHIDYINPTRMTIPQTNFRLGYFISDKYNISIGVDHMKYVMDQNQTVNISGYYPGQGSYGETIPGEPNKVLLTEDFLTFEHTDGLNYVNVEINRVDDISKLFGVWNTDKIQINLTEGVGFGMVYPKTNTKLLRKDRYDQFHVAGLGFSAKAGLNVTFFKHFFIQAELKGGFIDMYDVRTTASKADKAMHNFWYGQTVLAIGGIFKL